MDRAHSDKASLEGACFGVGQKREVAREPKVGGSFEINPAERRMPSLRKATLTCHLKPRKPELFESEVGCVLF